MKTLLMDASSAILLFKADLFVPVVMVYRVAVVPSVEEEITVTGRSGALFFQKMISEGFLKVSPLKCPPAFDPALAALDRGERDTMIAFGENNVDFITIDDRKGALWCRSKKIPYINALLCAKILLLSGHLSEKSYLRRTEQLLEIGRYSRWVVDFAQHCKKDDLTPFWPDREIHGTCRDVADKRLEAHLLNN